MVLVAYCARLSCHRWGSVGQSTRLVGQADCHMLRLHSWGGGRHFLGHQEFQRLIVSAPPQWPRSRENPQPERLPVMWDLITITSIFFGVVLVREAQLVVAISRASGWNDFPRR
jgi:hypothetical protein